MGDLEHDTRITGGNGSWDGALSPDWEIWGPNGGYVAAVLLRAAGAHSEFPRPASLFVTFLARGDFAPVEITTHTLRRTRRAECVSVSMAQGGRLVAEATAWFVLDDLGGLEHDVVTMPQVRPIEELASMEEILERRGVTRPSMPFFSNLQQYPVVVQDEWPPTGPLPPTVETWLRFRPTATFDDPVVDAGRLIVALDTFGWPAVHRHHGHSWPADAQPWVAPSLGLHVRFHRSAAHSPGLLLKTDAPLAAHGLVSTEGRVWSEDGLLVASMSSILLVTATGA